ncbi:HAMP domain-containing sensor histidine kinase [Mucilaginibacter gynuensis]
MQNAKRLRYEALSAFAADLNKAAKYTEICDALSAHIKYIIDFFQLRLHHFNKGESGCFEMSRGECVFFKPRQDGLWKYEMEVFETGLPVNYFGDAIQEHKLLARSVFNNPKVAAVYSLPVSYFKDQKILITIAVKSQIHYIDIDFKFLKSIADLVANKLMQLDLLKKIENTNKELKAKNAQITKLNYDLEQTVNLRTAELTNANEELKTLFYRTSHDFRAPLANIMGLANIAKLVTKDKDALNLFEKCEEVAHKMDAMLSKLNVLSTYSYEHQIKPVDFRQILRELRAKFQDKLQEIGGRLIFDIVLDDEHLANPDTYVTILENLLENSINYHNTNLIVQVYILRYKNDLVIKFSDNGQGIPLKIIGKIYDMYYRGNSESTGSGLGLYVVRKLVRSLHGNIFAQSKPKKHTHFIIKVPLVQPS